MDQHFEKNSENGIDDSFMVEHDLQNITLKEPKGIKGTLIDNLPNLKLNYILTTLQLIYLIFNFNRSQFEVDYQITTTYYKTSSNNLKTFAFIF